MPMRSKRPKKSRKMGWWSQIYESEQRCVLFHRNIYKLLTVLSKSSKKGPNRLETCYQSENPCFHSRFWGKSQLCRYMLGSRFLVLLGLFQRSTLFKLPQLHEKAIRPCWWLPRVFFCRHGCLHPSLAFFTVRPLQKLRSMFLGQEGKICWYTWWIGPKYKYERIRPWTCRSKSDTT